MAPILRLVLDVLKPHDPPTIELTQRLAETAGVAGVNAEVVDVDRDVQSIKLTIEGDDIDHEAVESAIETLGGSVHSIDQAVCGGRLVEQVETPQD